MTSATHRNAAISHPLRSRAVLDGPPDFDRLAEHLSSRLVSLHTSQIGSAIEDALHEIAEGLDVDLCCFVEFSDDSEQVSSVRAWVRPDIAPEAAAVLRQAPWLVSMGRRGEAVVLERVSSDLLAHATEDAAALRSHSVRSILTAPVCVAGQRTCALSLVTLREYRRWPAAIVQRVQLFAEILGTATHRGEQERALERAESEARRLNTRLELESRYLQEEIADAHEFDEIIGNGPTLSAALTCVREVAATDSTVVLLGETGTGKELFARAIHARSLRRARPLIRVNCAALPPTLIESELFGHERGSFTGAVTMRQGRFELADKGTIFLDEIGDLPLEIQAKLLRVLQEGEFERLGSSQTRRVNIRVIAATNRDLEKAVHEERFRADLYYRLSVFPIQLPTLRERPEDIPRLVWFFIHRRQRALHRQIKNVPQTVMETLQAYAWPGNVRELENVIERAMIRSPGDTLVLDSRLTVPMRADVSEESGTLDTVVRHHIEDVLRKCAWRINGAGNAAEMLALHPNTLRFRMKKLGIQRPARQGPGIGRRGRTARAR
jgi:transcriptional regulator with GAF, ATPase, and Fis domain